MGVITNTIVFLIYVKPIQDGLVVVVHLCTIFQVEPIILVALVIPIPVPKLLIVAA